jgi:hypothetical protein
MEGVAQSSFYPEIILSPFIAAFSSSRRPAGTSSSASYAQPVRQLADLLAALRRQLHFGAGRGEPVPV